MNPADVLRLAAGLSESGEGYVLCTVVEAAGSMPGRPGFKLLVCANGETRGTVGGGNVERVVTQKARELLQDGGTALLTYTLTEDADGLGMACGGDIRVFLEHIPAARRAFLFGAGHLCQALAPILRSVGFHVVALDDRPGMATIERIPQASAFDTVDYADYAATFSPGSHDAVIIFTHGHGADLDILRTLCARRVDCAYIGMIGSKRKVAATFAAIEEQVDDAADWLSRVHAPIGLNVARTTAAEIAVAIAAEMLGVYNGVEDVGSLK
ncbi:MAG: XdhC family protein [Candidatus Cloacimonetes bacterium]|nr:XdhC family protein [Candidatus Cloacimonadota bacterium]